MFIKKREGKEQALEREKRLNPILADQLFIPAQN
jgi:hypothetical protein